MRNVNILRFYKTFFNKCFALQGAEGAPGEPGNAGPPGLPGNDGYPGDTGSTGPQGDNVSDLPDWYWRPLQLFGDLTV